MVTTIRSLFRDEHGQGMAEYGLVLALVAVVCVAATRTLGTKVSATMTAAGNGMP
jgi:pilus assembly protein Flp/PilA